MYEYYPLNRIGYRDANKVHPKVFLPLTDIADIDTSAFFSEAAGQFADFCKTGGTLIITPHVKGELDRIAERTKSTLHSDNRQTDTRPYSRAYANSRIVLAACTVQQPLDRSDHRIASEERELRRLADALPKYQAYELCKDHFESWYLTLRDILEHRIELGDRVDLEDVRGHGEHKYTILDQLLIPDARLSERRKEQLHHLIFQKEDVTQRYREIVQRTLGPHAAKQFTNKKNQTSTEYFTGYFEHATRSLLLRMLGYALDARFADNYDGALDDLDKRFKHQSHERDTDIFVVLSSYMTKHDPNKNVFIYSQDADLKHLLELRKTLSANGRHVRPASSSGRIHLT